MKHRENNDITEEEFGSLLDGAMQSAVEHTSSFDENSIRIDETEQLGALSPGEAGDEVVDSAVQQESTSVPEEPDNGNDSSIDNLVADEEMIIASKLAKAGILSFAVSLNGFELE